LRRLAEKHPSSPWYFVSGEVVYINGPRLKELAAAYNPKELHYIGNAFSKNGRYCTGDVGYLISNALMKLLLPSLLVATDNLNPDEFLGTLVATHIKAPSQGGLCESMSNFDFHDNNDAKSKNRFNTFLTSCIVNSMSNSLFLQQSLGFRCESENQINQLWRLYGYYTRHNNDEGAIPSKPCPLGKKCVIAFSLYGSLPRYTVGAVRNAMLRDTIYPGWTLRYYYDESTVPLELTNQLKVLGHELVPVVMKMHAGMYARFKIAADDSVDWYIIRDVDSRFNMREKHAVDEWMMSNYSIHILRDHPAHCRPINGGLWGGKKRTIPDMEELINKFARIYLWCRPRFP
jgi:hypothetical protein